MASQKPTPPPLPARNGSSSQPAVPIAMNNGTDEGQDSVELPLSEQPLSSDPRTSSTQSLVPSTTASNDTRRRLLLIYIHGFYGNDQSFQSFPAHVHSLLSTLLSDSHIIHSKIYPRYKTYRAIDVARDKFSDWLTPHEAPTTDVILVGHSMGGLLAAEVVLMKNSDPYKHQPFKHRILGTISLDSPFLGLHPGIIVSGISSLFQGNPDEGDTENSTPQASTPDARVSSTPPLSRTQTDTSSIHSPVPVQTQQDGSVYDPPYFNDEPFREQPFVKRLIHFATKHKSDGIFNAMGSHIMSHVEFGGCLADYPGLKTRYNRIRALEDVDEVQALAQGHPEGSHARVRFVNYYTLSSGRPKLPKSPGESDSASLQPIASIATTATASSDKILDDPPPYSVIDQTPKTTDTTAFVDEKSDGVKESVEEDEPSRSSDEDSNAEQRMSMLHLDPSPMTAEEEDAEQHEPLETVPTETMSTESVPVEKMSTESVPVEKMPTEKVQIEPVETETEPDLPPIPGEPVAPELPDLEQYTDKDTRKQVEKESKRLQKTYEQAVKNREKAIREREKIIQSRQKRKQKEASKAEKQAQKEMEKFQKTERKRLEREESATSKASASETVTSVASGDATDKPKKLRKFCTLPSKNNGVRDGTWVDVYMDGMDEVGAHCGLFFPGEHYERLIGDVGSRVQSWVHEDMSKRLALEHNE